MILRDITEDDLASLFEIQLDQAGQHMAAFTPEDPADRDAYVAKWREIIADDDITKKAILVADEIVGSVVSFEFEGETEVTYWIRRDHWGRGIATIALAGLLAEVASRPIFGRTAFDNFASMRVLERNGFVQVGESTFYANARQQVITELIFRLD
jgi:ribosomal-protein-alanine N-acetyltransferase